MEFSTNGQVNAITEDSLGNIYVGGVFTRAGKSTGVGGDISANGIAKYNIYGSWENISSGSAINIHSITNLVIDSSDNIYAFGDISNNNSRIYGAKYNGSDWSSINIPSKDLSYNCVSYDSSNNNIILGYNDGSGVYIYSISGNTSSFISSSYKIYCITKDTSNNIYLGGQTNDSLLFPALLKINNTNILSLYIVSSQDVSNNYINSIACGDGYLYTRYSPLSTTSFYFNISSSQYNSTGINTNYVIGRNTLFSDSLKKYLYIVSNDNQPRIYVFSATRTNPRFSYCFYLNGNINTVYYSLLKDKLFIGGTSSLTSFNSTSDPSYIPVNNNYQLENLAIVKADYTIRENTIVDKYMGPHLSTSSNLKIYANQPYIIDLSGEWVQYNLLYDGSGNATYTKNITDASYNYIITNNNSSIIYINKSGNYLNLYPASTTNNLSSSFNIALKETYTGKQIQNNYKINIDMSFNQLVFDDVSFNTNGIDIYLDSSKNIYTYGSNFNKIGNKDISNIAMIDKYGNVNNLGITQISGGEINSFVKDTANNIYICGNFTSINNQDIQRFAKYDGFQWVDVSNTNNNYKKMSYNQYNNYIYSSRDSTNISLLNTITGKFDNDIDMSGTVYNSIVDGSNTYFGSTDLFNLYLTKLDVNNSKTKYTVGTYPYDVHSMIKINNYVYFSFNISNIIKFDISVSQATTISNPSNYTNNGKFFNYKNNLYILYQNYPTIYISKYNDANTSWTQQTSFSGSFDNDYNDIQIDGSYAYIPCVYSSYTSQYTIITYQPDTNTISKSTGAKFKQLPDVINIPPSTIYTLDTNRDLLNYDVSYDASGNGKQICNLFNSIYSSNYDISANSSNTGLFTVSLSKPTLTLTTGSTTGTGYLNIDLSKNSYVNSYQIPINITSSNPNLFNNFITDGVVNVIKSDGSNNVIIGGSFNNVGNNIFSKNIAKYNPTTYQWFNLGNTQFITSPIVSISVDTSTNNIYIVQQNTFEIYMWNNNLRFWKRLGLYDLIIVGNTQYINIIDIDTVNNYIYFGGNFLGTYGGLSYNNMGRFSYDNYGNMSNFNNLSPDYTNLQITAITFDTSQNVFLGGMVSSQTQMPAIIKYNIYTYQISTYFPNNPQNTKIYDMKYTTLGTREGSGGLSTFTEYLLFSFSYISSGLCLYDMTNNNYYYLDNPNLISNGYTLSSIAIDPLNNVNLYVGGNYGTIGQIKNICKIEIVYGGGFPDSDISAIDASGINNGQVNNLCFINNKLYIGGTFTTTNLQNLGIYDSSSNTLKKNVYDTVHNSSNVSLSSYLTSSLSSMNSLTSQYSKKQYKKYIRNYKSNFDASFVDISWNVISGLYSSTQSGYENTTIHFHLLDASTNQTYNFGSVSGSQNLHYFPLNDYDTLNMTLDGITYQMYYNNKLIYYNNQSYNPTNAEIDLSNSHPSHIVYVRAIGSGTLDVRCLTEDTKILTPNGYIMVCKLKVGDYVITDKNKKVRIKNITSEEYKGTPETYPYLIKAGSIAPNYPLSNVKLSGNHMIMYGGKWICPRKSKMFNQIIVDKVKYYHVELQNYITDNLVVNNGTIVESFTGYTANEDFHLEWVRRYENISDKLYAHLIKHFEEKRRSKTLLKNKSLIKNIKKTF